MEFFRSIDDPRLRCCLDDTERMPIGPKRVVTAATFQIRTVERALGRIKPSSCADEYPGMHRQPASRHRMRSDLYRLARSSVVSEAFVQTPCRSGLLSAVRGMNVCCVRDARQIEMRHDGEAGRFRAFTLPPLSRRAVVTVDDRSIGATPRR
jgi:hypothetical protein